MSVPGFGMQGITFMYVGLPERWTLTSPDLMEVLNINPKGQKWPAGFSSKWTPLCCSVRLQSSCGSLTFVSAISSLINRNVPLRTSPSVLVKVKKSMILSETEIWLFAVLDVCDNKWVKKQKLAAVLALPVVLRLCSTLVQFEANKGPSGKHIHYFIEACWICFISRLCWFVVSVFRA